MDEKTFWEKYEGQILFVFYGLQISLMGMGLYKLAEVIFAIARCE